MTSIVQNMSMIVVVGAALFHANAKANKHSIKSGPKRNGSYGLKYLIAH